MALHVRNRCAMGSLSSSQSLRQPHNLHNALLLVQGFQQMIRRRQTALEKRGIRSDHLFDLIDKWLETSIRAPDFTKLLEQYRFQKESECLAAFVGILM